MQEQTLDNIGIVLRKDTPSIHEKAVHIIKFLLQKNKKIILDEISFSDIEKELHKHDIHTEIMSAPLDMLGEYCDVAMVIGGDGTLLRVARNLVDHEVPIIGIHRGRLGFLTQVTWGNESIQMINSILSGEYIKEARTMLEGIVVRQDKIIYQSLAFNEVTIDRGGKGNLIEFEVYINEEFVYSQYSDGLIISTPTGSTAYSLAAGGPILYATLPALNLVSICPQSISNRPIVVDENSDIKVLIVNSVDSRAYFDGQVLFELCNMDIIQVRKYKKSINLLQPLNYRYFGILRAKLKWGEQLI